MVLKKVPGTVPSEPPPQSEPYHAIPCSGKVPYVLQMVAPGADLVALGVVLGIKNKDSLIIKLLLFCINKCSY